MKKILVFAIMLLNLLPNIEDGSMRIGISTISAQMMGSESIVYRCHDDDLGWYTSPVPCDDEPCTTACLVDMCPWSGDCDDLEFHNWVEHNDLLDPPSIGGQDDDEGDYGGGSGNGDSGWSGNGNFTGGPSGGSSNSPYKQFGAYDVVVSTKLLKKYEKQSSRFTCVSTTFEYASRILDSNRKLSRDNFQYTLNVLYPSVFTYGVSSSSVEGLMSLVFDTQQIDSYNQFKNEVDNHHPIIGHIDGTVIVPYSPIDHMVLAVGYSVTNPYSVICIDPGTGQYRTISFTNFNGNIFALTQLNPNFR